MPQPLREHILTHPASAKPYDCGECDLRFFFRMELHHHLLGHRASKEKSGEREASLGKGSGSGSSSGEHPCPHCPKSFASLSALQGHSHVHMGSSSPAAACPTCGKAFASPAKLRAHVKLHSPASPTLPAHQPAHLHPCPVCNKAFSRLPTSFPPLF